MKTYTVLALIVLAGIVAACDSPSRPFNNTNANDPLSPNFRPSEGEELFVAADTTGNVTIVWPEQDEFADHLLLEKSIGDSLNFVMIAEFDPSTDRFVDSSRVFLPQTIYRLTSWKGRPDDDGIKISSSQSGNLDIGEMFNLQNEYLGEENMLLLTWQTTYPFFTHFEISSDYTVAEDGENTVRIEADGISHSYKLPLPDLEFEIREYTVTAIIDYEDSHLEISELSTSFDAKSLFGPKRFRVSILDEVEWDVRWDESPSFVTGIELTRVRNGHNDIVIDLPAEAISYLDDFFIRPPANSGQIREYELRFLAENSTSETVSLTRGLTIQAPQLTRSVSNQSDPNSLRVTWEIAAPGNTLSREFIIERSLSGNNSGFSQIGVVSGDVLEFVDTNTNAEQSFTYRVRTLSSAYSNGETFKFTNFYTPYYTFQTQAGSFINTLETTNDNRYIVLVSSNALDGNPIQIQDIVNRETVASISIPSHRISDFVLSPDEEHIYFIARTQGVIYRADFPSGNNIEQVITNAGNNNSQVRKIGISSDGSFMIGAGFDFIKRWNLQTFQEEYLTYFGDTTIYPARKLSISPDGAYAGYGQYIFDASNGQLMHTLSTTTRNTADGHFSNDGQYYAYVDVLGTWNTRTYVYSTNNWQRTAELVGAHRVSFHPTEPRLVVAGTIRSFTYDLLEMRVDDIIVNTNNLGIGLAWFQSNLYLDDNRVAGANSDHTAINIWQKTTQQGWTFLQ
ncbi:MAG: hypothetical protein LAT84_10040 [Balneolia bacterium]|nr:hypothetical protein [Balneolia bacterium]